MKTKKKRSFTLLETLLALSLIAIVVTMLTMHFVSASRLKARIESTAHQVLRKKLIQERLTQVFGSLPAQGDEKPLFQCKNKTLCMDTDQGFDHDPAFRGQVEMVISHDNHQLLLTTKKDKRERSEVLCSNVKEIKWDFLTRQGDQLLKDNWGDQEPLIPLSIRLSLTRDDGEEESYAFFPNVLPPIIHCDQ